MMFGVADHAATLGTVAAGYCPSSASSLSSLAEVTCRNSAVCSEIYGTVLWVVDEALPGCQRMQRPLLDAASRVFFVGTFISLGLTFFGLYRTWNAYKMTYQLLDKHGPAAFRFPLRKADSVRLLATMVAYNAVGALIVSLICMLLGACIACLADSEGFPPALFLRRLIAQAIIALICEATYVRPFVIPFFQRKECDAGPRPYPRPHARPQPHQRTPLRSLVHARRLRDASPDCAALHHRWGAALFVIELWYLSIGLLKGIARTLTLMLITILSSFSPQMCMFPDGASLSRPPIAPVYTRSFEPTPPCASRRMRRWLRGPFARQEWSRGTLRTLRSSATSWSASTTIVSAAKTSAPSAGWSSLPTTTCTTSPSHRRQARCRRHSATSSRCGCKPRSSCPYG
jgi:hypothetical protein